MFGLLYFTQGTILSYFTALNAVIIAIGVAMVAILSLAAINKLNIAWFLVALFGVCYDTYQSECWFGINRIFRRFIWFLNDIYCHGIVEFCSSAIPTYDLWEVC